MGAETKEECNNIIWKAKYTNNSVAGSLDDVCLLCSNVACPAGKQVHCILDDNIKCVDCPTGYFKTNNGTNNCQACPKGKYAFVSQTNSDSNEYCQTCPKGTYSNYSGTTYDCSNECYSECEIISHGTRAVPSELVSHFFSNGLQYQSISLDTEDVKIQKYKNPTSCAICKHRCKQNVCTNCPWGKYSNKTQQTSPDACKNCQTGKFSALHYPYASFDTGFVPEQSGVVEQVDIYEYDGLLFKNITVTTGTVRPEQCYACPVNSYQDEQGQTECKKCDIGKSQLEIQFSNDELNIQTKTECQVCKKMEVDIIEKENLNDFLVMKIPVSCGDIEFEYTNGTYNHMNPDEFCNKAVKNKAMLNITTHSNNDTWLQTFYESSCLMDSNCADDQIYENDQCSYCPKGTYIERGAFKARLLYNNTEMLWKPPQTAKCHPCQIGKYWKLANNSNYTESCTKCPIGFETITTGQLECTKCPIFTYKNANMTTCQLCQEGNAAAPDGTSCQQCENGQFADVNNPSCTWCAPGTSYLKLSLIHI